MSLRLAGRRAFLLQIPGWRAVELLAARRAGLTMSQLAVAGCSLTNLGFKGTLEKILELGFEGVEIATFIEKNGPQGQTYPYAVVDQLTADEKRDLQALVRKFRHVSTHLSYYPDFHPIAKDRSLRDRSCRELWRCLDDSAFWGAEVATVHMASRENERFQDVKEELVEFYRELGTRAAAHRMRLGIETTAPYRAAEYLELITAIGRNNVGGTVDTGHMRFYRSDLGIEEGACTSAAAIRRYNDLLMHIVEALGPKLFHFHINDVRRSDWLDHFVPGTGIVDWPRLLKYVSHAGYRGLFAAELLRYDCAEAVGLQRTREFFRKTIEAL